MTENRSLSWKWYYPSLRFYRAHGWTALALQKRPEILVSQQFSTYAPIPVQSTANCLTVNPRLNHFAPNGLSPVKYQLWIILHE